MQHRLQQLQAEAHTSRRLLLATGRVRQAMWKRLWRNTFRTSYSRVSALQRRHTQNDGLCCESFVCKHAQGRAKQGVGLDRSAYAAHFIASHRYKSTLCTSHTAHAT
jgi:hypothetical protein